MTNPVMPRPPKAEASAAPVSEYGFFVSLRQTQNDISIVIFVTYH